MKIKELIKYLQDFNEPERRVILQKDAEGNGYSPLYGCELSGYVEENSYSGYTCLEELTPEDIAQGYTEEDVEEDCEKVLVLYPIN
jgi:hypothetical protein